MKPNEAAQELPACCYTGSTTARGCYGPLPPRGFQLTAASGRSSGTAGARHVPHAAQHLIDEVDLSAFDALYRNDEDGAPALPPAVLLKAVKDPVLLRGFIKKARKTPAADLQVAVRRME